jgi:cytochrome c-type biogenesis protein
LIVAYVGGQKETLRPREASLYSVAFTSGLFITITLIGIICALLGRILGDVGNYWQILVGLVLVWVALDMLGIKHLSMSDGLLYRLNFRGLKGALGLGLAYGVLSGSCTFGFIAPILAIITVQEKIAMGILFILLFAIGHCIPIAVAGTSTAAVKSVLENSRWQGASNWFRRGAGVLIGILALYFITNPFIST